MQSTLAGLPGAAGQSLALSGKRWPSPGAASLGETAVEPFTRAPPISTPSCPCPSCTQATRRLTSPGGASPCAWCAVRDARASARARGVPEASCGRHVATQAAPARRRRRLPGAPLGRSPPNAHCRRALPPTLQAHPRRVVKVAKQIEREVGSLLVTDRVRAAALFLLLAEPSARSASVPAATPPRRMHCCRPRCRRRRAGTLPAFLPTDWPAGTPPPAPAPARPPTGGDGGGVPRAPARPGQRHLGGGQRDRGPAVEGHAGGQPRGGTRQGS